jgi:hypothetical protein
VKTALTILVLLLAGLAVAGFVHASGESARAQVLADSLAEAHARYAADSVAWEARRARLVADSTLYAQERNRTARLLAQARDTVRNLTGRFAALLAQAGHGDSARPLLEALEGEFAACDAALANCEQRLSNAEARVQLADSVAQANRILAAGYERSWKDAEDRARPSLLRDLWRSKTIWATLLAVVVAIQVVR